MKDMWVTPPMLSSGNLHSVAAKSKATEMAINFDTTNPSGLLAAFKKAIDDKKVVTWSYDKDGDFTHTPEQWRFKAWLRPSIFNGRLIMNFLGNPSETTTKVVYGVYHGRFIESMLSHCDTLFTAGSATAMPTNSDNISKVA